MLIHVDRKIEKVVSKAGLVIPSDIDGFKSLKTL